MTPGLDLPRFYPILDTATLMRCAVDLRDAACAILESGARIIQFRHKGAFSRDLYETAAWIGRECARTGVQWVLNDRADMARLLNAGLHLGQDDLRPEQARIVVGDVIVGYSTHNEQQLRQAATEPADYLALGPIFATGSKSHPDPVVGLENLKKWRRLTRRPLVAIGGITRATARDVIQAGADSLAVIGDLYPPGEGSTGIRKRAEEWRQLLAAI
jgi:thiamine-phosphate pyrophosphorylase